MLPGSESYVGLEKFFLVRRQAAKDLTEVIRNLHGRSGDAIRWAKAQQQRVAFDRDPGRQRYRPKNVTSDGTRAASQRRRSTIRGVAGVMKPEIVV